MRYLLLKCIHTLSSTILFGTGMGSAFYMFMANRMSNSTLKRYISLLEAVFIFVPLPAWYRNEESRLIKSPKIYLNDVGLAMHLRGMDQDRFIIHHAAGFMLENFIMMELKKQQTWSETLPKLYHFRTAAGKEVDIV